MKKLKQKQRYSKLSIAMLLFLVIILTSCNILTRRTGDAAPTLDYRTGSSGIVIKYISEITPREIDKNLPFNIGIEVSNQGATDIDRVYFIMTGFNTRYFSELNPPNIMPFSLYGKSKYDPNGEKRILSFNIKNIGSPQKDYEEIFLSTVCYPYQTIASAEICIVTDNLELSKLVKPPCTPKSSISLSSQGAPVAVTKIEPRIYKDSNILKADFKIYIANKGKGNIRSKDSYDKECTGSGALTKDDINTVNVKVYLGKNKICEDIHVIKQASFGEKTDEPMYYRCTTELAGIQESYLTFLNIEIDYGYVETVSHKIKVRDN